MDPIKGTTQGIPAHLLHDDITSGPKAKNIMGKDDFMKLLMTQLQHQDPLNPMDHKEMSTSLAQFGSLEQLTNIGTGIQSLKTGMNEGSKLNMLSLIGKTVEASGNEVQLTEGEPLILSHVVKDSVTPVQIDISDSDGKTVRQLQLSGKEQGGKVGWDGRSNEGEFLPTGRYSFRVHGVDSKGMGVDLSSNIKGKVVGMDMSAATPQLTVQTEGGEMHVELGRVKSVNTESEKPVASIPKADKMNKSPLSASANPEAIAAMKAAMAAAASSPETSSPEEEDREIPERNFTGFGSLGVR